MPLPSQDLYIGVDAGEERVGDRLALPPETHTGSTLKHTSAIWLAGSGIDRAPKMP